MKTIIFTFGRYQPLTKGHDRVFSKILKLSTKLKCEHSVYVSQSEKLPKDPLAWEYKVKLIHEAYPEINICQDKNIKTPFDALQCLANASFERIIFVVGSDRQHEFSENMQKYAKQWGVKKLSIVSAGYRNAERTDTCGVSASKVRQMAMAGDSHNFMENMSTKLSESTKLNCYTQIRWRNTRD